MDIEPLARYLMTMSSVSDGFLAALKEEVRSVQFMRNHVLLEESHIAEYIYFIDHGFAMAYRILEGRKVVSHFWGSGEPILPIRSFFNRERSEESIQLMQDSSLFSIRYDSVMKLFESHSDSNALYRNILHDHLEQYRRRVFEFQELRAQDRFEKLLFQYRGIEQIIPQDYIASYLGIAPQSLSRLKRRDLGRLQ